MPLRAYVREMAVPGRCRCGPTQRHPLHLIESCRCRDIDPYACLRDVFTRLPLTNWQVKDIIPEAGRKPPLLCNGNRRVIPP